MSARRIILRLPEGYAREDMILQLRSAWAALDEGRPSDGLSVFGYEDGSTFVVVWNDGGSLSVHPNTPSRKSAA